MIKLVLSFTLLLVTLLVVSYSKRRKKHKGVDIDLSKYSEKIVVNLEECEIISGIVGQKDSLYINVLNPESSLYSILSESNSSENSTYIRYSYKNTKFIAGPFDVSEMGVRVACLGKKTTCIYYNKIDNGDYYFDVNFILVS